MDLRRRALCGLPQKGAGAQKTLECCRAAELGQANQGEKFNILESAAKWGVGHGDYGNNRSQVTRYAADAIRLRQELDDEDQRFLRKSVDPKILDYFHYK